MLDHLTHAEPRFWSGRRLRLFGLALGFAIFLAIVISAVLRPERSKLLLEGDYPGFYGPAMTILAGQAERLYDFEFQRTMQNRFWPNAAGAFYISVYPPYYCVMIAPFAFLPPVASKLVVTIVLFLLYLLALRLARSLVPALRSSYLFCAVLLFLFPPMFFGIIASQNTTLSLLLFSGALYLYTRDTPEGDFGGGLLLALWLFKPQYGLAAMFLPVLAGRWWSLVGSALSVVFYALLAHTFVGPDWLSTWAAAAARFGMLNYQVNGHQMVSMVGAGHALGAALGGGRIETVLSIGGLLLSAALGAMLAFQFFQIRRAAPERRAHLFERAFVRVAPAVVLFTPQTLFYDLGIAGVSLLYCLRLDRDREVNLALGFIALCAAAVFLRDSTALPLLFPFAAGAALFIWRRTRPEENAVENEHG